MLVVDNCFGSMCFYRVDNGRRFKNTVLIVDDQNKRQVRELKTIDDMPDDLLDLLNSGGYLDA